MKLARFLTFKCKSCGKNVKVVLQKVSACSHIQPYQGICSCGTLHKHAVGDANAVKSYIESQDAQWSHHH